MTAILARIDVYKSTFTDYQKSLSSLWTEGMGAIAVLRKRFPSLSANNAAEERVLLDSAIVYEGYSAIRQQCVGAKLRDYFVLSKFVGGPEGGEFIEHPHVLELSLADFALERLKYFQKECSPKRKSEAYQFEALVRDNWIVREGLNVLKQYGL